MEMDLDHQEIQNLPLVAFLYHLHDNVIIIRMDGGVFCSLKYVKLKNLKFQSVKNKNYSLRKYQNEDYKIKLKTCGEYKSLNELMRDNRR